MQSQSPKSLLSLKRWRVLFFGVSALAASAAQASGIDGCYELTGHEEVSGLHLCVFPISGDSDAGEGVADVALVGKNTQCERAVSTARMSASQRAMMVILQLDGQTIQFLGSPASGAFLMTLPEKEPIQGAYAQKRLDSLTLWKAKRACQFR